MIGRQNSFILLAALVLSPLRPAQSFDKRAVEIRETQQQTFQPGGTILIKDSYGEVIVEGWDQDAVEVVVVKKTLRSYEPHDEAEARAALERVKVETLKSSETNLLIKTEFPSRTLTRLLRGKTNLLITYHIKVPRRTTLTINHDIGAVTVRDVVGDIEITNRIGEVSLRLSESEQYAIDARSKVGDIDTDFAGLQERYKLLAERLATAPQPAAHRLLLRVGIGAVAIKKL